MESCLLVRYLSPASPSPRVLFGRLASKRQELINFFADSFRDELSNSVTTVAIRYCWCKVTFDIGMEEDTELKIVHRAFNPTQDVRVGTSAADDGIF